MTNQISFTVNGIQHTLDPVPGETLSTLLRRRLRLTGTKIGCEEAECGACTVLVDGEPVVSCIYPAERADGKIIVTIEALAQRVHNVMELHPLQEAFVEHGAVQCGFCIPGQIMTAYALLQRNPNPNRAEIRFALKDTLCRCAGYPTIENAILAAAQALRTGEPVQKARIPDSIHTHNTVGHTHTRHDGVDKVIGTAMYTDDLVFDGMLYAKVRRAMIPHGFLTKLDISKAKALPGVAAVLTAEDIPGERNHGLVIYDWPVLVGVGERVRYVGDALALVAAETQEIAEQAAALIEAKFDLQPVITNPVQAREAERGVPQIHEKGNLLKHIKVRKGNTEEGFAEADVIAPKLYVPLAPQPDVPSSIRRHPAPALGRPQVEEHTAAQCAAGRGVTDDEAVAGGGRDRALEDELDELGLAGGDRRLERCAGRVRRVAVACLPSLRTALRGATPQECVRGGVLGLPSVGSSVDPSLSTLIPQWATPDYRYRQGWMETS